MYCVLGVMYRGMTLSPSFFQPASRIEIVSCYVLLIRALGQTTGRKILGTLLKNILHGINIEV